MKPNLPVEEKCKHDNKTICIRCAKLSPPQPSLQSSSEKLVHKEVEALRENQAELKRMCDEYKSSSEDKEWEDKYNVLREIHKEITKLIYVKPPMLKSEYHQCVQNITKLIKNEIRAEKEKMIEELKKMPIYIPSTPGTSQDYEDGYHKGFTDSWNNIKNSLKKEEVGG